MSEWRQSELYWINRVLSRLFVLGVFTWLSVLAPGLLGAFTLSELQKEKLFGDACKAPAELHQRQFFFLCFVPNRKVPSWVGYELNAELLRGTTERTDDFRPDTDLQAANRAELPDYVGTGFDRGHMAEAEAFVRNRRTMSATFLLSNMAPQTSALNRGRWRVLEENLREWVAEGDHAIIFTGNLFVTADFKPLDHIRFTKPGSTVEVPSHSFKAVLRQRGEDFEAIAFIMPNRRKTLPGPNADWAWSIDTLEALVHQDLFSFLPDEIEDDIEADFIIPKTFE